MKPILSFLAFLLLTLQAIAEPPLSRQKLSDYETARTADKFSIGATGYSGAIMPAEKSLRRILQTPKAAEDCRKLTVEGTPAGQLYGLLGLKLLKDATYPTVAAAFKSSRVEVIVTDGCSFSTRPTSYVVKLIGTGKVQ